MFPPLIEDNQLRPEVVAVTVVGLVAFAFIAFKTAQLFDGPKDPRRKR